MSDITLKIIIVCSFILADFITGILCAISLGNFKSSVMREGLWHKIAELLAVGFCYFLDWALPQLNVALPFSFFTCVIIYIAFMEGASIIENLGKMFPDLGKYLSNLFESIRPKEDENDKS